MKLCKYLRLASTGKIGRGLGITNNPVASVYATIGGLTNNPSYGQTSQIGIQLTATGHGGSPTSYQWATTQSGDLVGETNQTYTPAIGIDLENLYCKVTINGQVYNTSAYVVRHAPPMAAGTLLDQSFTDDTGNQTYAVSGDFTGSALVYGVSTGPAGVTVNSSTGVVTFDTNTLAEQTGTSIVITATNSGGSAASGFSLDITAGGDITAPVIANAALGTTTPTTQPVSFDLDEAGDLYGVLTQATQGGTITSAQLAAGQDNASQPAPFAFGPGAVSAGTPTNYTADITEVLNGDYFLNFMVEDAAGNRSAPAAELGPIAIDTRNWVDTVGTANLVETGGGAGAWTTLELGLTFIPQTVSGTHMIIDTHESGVNDGFLIFQTNNDVRVVLRDTAGTILMSVAANNMLVAGQETHLYISVDLGTLSYNIKFNGVDAASWTKNKDLTSAGTGSANWARNAGIFVGATGSNQADIQLADFWLGTNHVLHGLSAFYAAGKPKDVSNLGSPLIYLGHDQKADALKANTAQGYNDAFNQGSLTLAAGSATFVDV